MLEARFSINDPLKISVMPGCLIITAKTFMNSGSA
nr:type I toxin-antitoxin system SymE family toxin [Xenorhabdus miraniensis]